MKRMPCSIYWGKRCLSMFRLDPMNLTQACLVPCLASGGAWSWKTSGSAGTEVWCKMPRWKNSSEEKGSGPSPFSLPHSFRLVATLIPDFGEEFKGGCEYILSTLRIITIHRISDLHQQKFHGMTFRVLSTLHLGLGVVKVFPLFESHIKMLNPIGGDTTRASHGSISNATVFDI